MDPRMPIINLYLVPCRCLKSHVGLEKFSVSFPHPPQLEHGVVVVVVAEGAETLTADQVSGWAPQRLVLPMRLEDWAAE